MCTVGITFSSILLEIKSSPLCTERSIGGQLAGFNSVRNNKRRAPDQSKHATAQSAKLLRHRPDIRIVQGDPIFVFLVNDI